MRRRDHYRGKNKGYYHKNEEPINFRLREIHELQEKAEKIDFKNYDKYPLFKLYKQTGESLLHLNKVQQKPALTQAPVYENLWEIFVEIAKTFLETEIELFATKGGNILIFEIIKKEIIGCGNLKLGTYEFEKFTGLIESREKTLKDLYNIINQVHNIKKCPIRTAPREMAGNIVCYLGELKQWELKANHKDDQVQNAVRYYLMAVNLHPFEGRFFYLQSTCSHLLRDLFSTFYWAVLGKHCCSNFDFHDDQQQLLQEIEQEYLKGAMSGFPLEKNGSPITGSFKYFALGIISIYGKIFNKIGIDTIKLCSANSFENLYTFLQNLAKNGEDAMAFKLQNQSSLIINACHYLAENYEKKGGVENWEDISGDTLKETVRCLGPMIARIFDMTLKVQNLNLYLESISPLFHYLSAKKYFLTSILYKKPKFCESLGAIIIKISKELESTKKKSEQIPDGEEKNLPLPNGIIEDELIVVNFEPLKDFYSKVDVQCVIPREQKDQFILEGALRFFILQKNHFESNIDQILVKENPGFMINGTISKARPWFDNEGDDFDIELKSFAKSASGNPYLRGFQIGKNIQDRTKTHIVIDGRNVAIRYGESMGGVAAFKSQGIMLAVKYWHDKGHPVMVILPDYCFCEREVEKRRLNKITISDEKTLPDDCKSLQELKSQEFACGVPNWDYDDSYILEYAQRIDGHIVTNDRFKDYLEKYSGYDGQKRSAIKKWLKDNCISFSFIGRMFMPNPDFLKDHNIR